MALAPKYKALTFSSTDEAGLEEEVTKALADSVDFNMGLRRCAAFPATNSGIFLCELTTKETKSVISKWTDKVRGRMFVEHAVIHMLYVPVILNTTHATCELKLKNLATGDELYGGTKVNLNECFILTMTWPRSLFSDDVNAHKGLYLGGSITCTSSIPTNAKIGMFYPMWSERISRRQLYQQTTPINSVVALETFAKTMISSDKEMRSLLRSRATTDMAAKKQEQLVICNKQIPLVDSGTLGVDFTVKPVLPAVNQLTTEVGPSVKGTDILIPAPNGVIPIEDKTEGKDKTEGVADPFLGA